RSKWSWTRVFVATAWDERGKNSRLNVSPSLRPKQCAAALRSLLSDHLNQVRDGIKEKTCDIDFGHTGHGRAVDIPNRGQGPNGLAPRRLAARANLKSRHWMFQFG